MSDGPDDAKGMPRPSGAQWPPLNPFKTGIRCRCPRCGEGRLFNGFLTLKPACEVCGLDYSFADPADGPAFFVICFGCIPSVILGLWIETAFSAPYWVHLFTTLPFTLATCIPPLRPLKGWLINSQYYYKAEEGRIATPHEDDDPLN
ncbi:Uncharacterized conserved protein, DUF983 family [Kaistia soli DSM 19436]|uniref:Uncharacterized conserved protein, DUF983 family n=1 Tax=Kaistia soli DSM 19436 TaxID=1122133 RepID=A0A1M4WVI1_9HYPH|nr:DUF983 domain-containing protein [Kaistia soli]SHE85220.1 Uncharacterized conserved protein, DUF983 family [Kaistia soli DSM 19436]